MHDERLYVFDFPGLAVYNLVLFGAFGLIMVTALQNPGSYQASYIIFSICIFVTTTVTLGLVFLPKVRFFSRGEDHLNNFRTDAKQLSLTLFNSLSLGKQ